MAAALAVWTVLVVLAGIDLRVAPGGGDPREVTHLAVTLTSLGTGLLGWGLLAVLERMARHARRIWLAVATLVLVLSLPGTGAATTAAGTGVLLTLHLVVGVMLIAGLGLVGRPFGGPLPVEPHRDPEAAHDESASARLRSR